MATKEQAEELRQNIWKDYNNGLNSREIADKYDVSRSYIYSIIAQMKGKDAPTEQILLDRITVLEKQLYEKTIKIQELEEDLRRKNLMIDRLLLSSQ